ncbi:AaceriAFL219Wp [[Ashbya] aceris (nom. inval.)]|nr:AaceriAFL219Wp [[Ashbya] aceris (nom. inval.)]
MLSGRVNISAVRAFQTSISVQKATPTAELRKTILKEQSPRRPPSVYALFLKALMPVVKSEYPSAKFGELSKKVNEKWKDMSDFQKKPYYDEAQRLRKEYYSARAEIEKTLPPKRPCTGFILYCNDVRPHVAAENPMLKATEVARVLGERWKTLPFEKKNKYLDLAARNLEQWKARNIFVK